MFILLMCDVKPVYGLFRFAKVLLNPAYLARVSDNRVTGSDNAAIIHNSNLVTQRLSLSQTMLGHHHCNSGRIQRFDIVP